MSSLPVFDSPSGDEVSQLPSCIDRRAFLAKGSLAAVAAVLAAACGNGSLGGFATSPGNINTTVTLSTYSALTPVGGVARLSGVSTPIAVVHSAASTYRAFSMICPHQGSVIGITGSGFQCPNHLAQFNASGANTGGQRTSSLYEFSVTHDATAGTITIVG